MLLILNTSIHYFTQKNKIILQSIILIPLLAFILISLFFFVKQLGIDGRISIDEDPIDPRIVDKIKFVLFLQFFQVMDAFRVVAHWGREDGI